MTETIGGREKLEIVYHWGGDPFLPGWEETFWTTGGEDPIH